MTDNKITDAAWTLLTSFQEANQAVAEHLVSAQERNRKLAERFFNEGIEVLKSQAESMRALLRELDQQIRKQQEALQTLARAPVEVTLDILRTPLAAYQEALGMAETFTRQGLEQMQQAAEQVQQATHQTRERHSE